jgi:hypothetical protein
MKHTSKHIRLEKSEQILADLDEEEEELKIDDHEIDLDEEEEELKIDDHEIDLDEEEELKALIVENEILQDLTLNVKILMSNNTIRSRQATLNYKKEIFKINNLEFLTLEDIVSNKNNIFAFTPNELLELFGDTSKWPLDVGMVVEKGLSTFMVTTIDTLQDGTIQLNQKDEVNRVEIKKNGNTGKKKVKFFFPVSAGDANSYKLGLSTTEDAHIREQVQLL